ncbi:Lhr family helicase [Paenibacillus alkalitolerans]
MRRWKEEERIVPAPFAEPGETTLWSSGKVASRIVRMSLSSVRDAAKRVPAQRWVRHLLAKHGLAVVPPLAGADALKRVIGLLQGLFLPVSQWESVVLPARLPGFRKEDLDYLCASGELVWVGRKPHGEKEGRIAFFLAENAALPGALPQPADDPAHPELLALLRERGASFLTRLSADAGLPPSELLPKLIDLVWEGRVANDSFAPIRNFLLAKGKLNPKLGSGLGRWYAIERDAGHVPADECALAWARQLLQSHGMLTKDIVAHYAPYGWDELLPVLKRLEEWGMLVRGLFVDGVPALQFMERETIESIRRTGESAASSESADVVIISAADPANPYGIVLPWPDLKGANFARKPGNQLIIQGGSWAYWFESNGKHIVRLAEAGPELDLLPVFRQLIRRNGLKRIVIDTWNGRKAAEASDALPLVERGAERDRGSLVIWPSTLN